jgi:Chain length determinant protein.
MEEDKQKNTEEKNSEESFDVTGFLLECLAHWKWFVACVVVLAAVALFYCFRQTPLYEVTSAVYIQDNKSDNGNVLLESLGLSPYKTISTTKSRYSARKIR